MASLNPADAGFYTADLKIGTHESVDGLRSHGTNIPDSESNLRHDHAQTMILFNYIYEDRIASFPVAFDVCKLLCCRCQTDGSSRRRGDRASLLSWRAPPGMQG